MINPLDDKFIKRSREGSALFHHFPGAIYEFRDRVWRVKEMQGNTPRDIITRSNAFQELLTELEENGIIVESFSGLRQGIAEIFPMTWFCANPMCNRFVSGHPKDRICIRCKVGEMRQIPIVVICDRCGYMDAIGTRSSCSRNRNHDKLQLRLMTYEREKIGTWRLACQSCLEASARQHGVDKDDMSRIREFHKEFRVYSDLDPGSPCPQCSASRATKSAAGKRVVPAGANVISPAFVTTFDKDITTIINNAKATASVRMSFDEDMQAAFRKLQTDYNIMDVYLADIIALSCTYGRRVGDCTEVLPFQDRTIFLKSDHCEAIVFKFDIQENMSLESKSKLLHAIAHSLLHIAGYISGLENEVYRESIDVETDAVMIFTDEAGGCELFMNEPAKLNNWLKRSRAVVHECKNQCEEGCPWCLHLRTWQCSQFNRNLDRHGLAEFWTTKIGL